MICRLFIVTGRVQGVFFRESARNVAEPLGLRGHAINQPDGSVEVLACGDSEAVEWLADWLENGPPLARVDSVKASDMECTPPCGFTTA